MKIKLFCFPFAGASAHIFSKWKSYLNQDIESIAIEYPGRGRRFGVQLCDTMPDLIDDMYSRILTEIDVAPFAFFGHSLGALVAFELSRRMQLRNERLPMNLFFSGHVAPNYIKNKREIYNLPDDQLVKEIIGYGGTAQEVFETAELKDLFMPILKADLKIADTYKLEDMGFKLNTSFDIFYSLGDQLLCDEGMFAWKDCTVRECRIKMFDGGHMYLLNKEKEIVTYINQILMR
jgi:medium-chain acyl-[acyl-carrier-protein] hydrolase